MVVLRAEPKAQGEQGECEDGPAIAERNDNDAGLDRGAAGDGNCRLRGECLRESKRMKYVNLGDPFPFRPVSR